MVEIEICISWEKFEDIKGVIKKTENTMRMDKRKRTNRKQWSTKRYTIAI